MCWFEKGERCQMNEEFVSFVVGIAQKNSAVFLQHPWVQCMEGQPAQPQVLENQILQRFVHKPLCGSKNWQVSIPSCQDTVKVKVLCHFNALSHLLSLFVVVIHPGLGTSTSQEAKEYFSDMSRHRIPFKYSGPEDDEAITLVRTCVIYKVKTFDWFSQ